MKLSDYKQLIDKHKTDLQGFAQWLKKRGFGKDTIRTDNNYAASYLEWLEKNQVQITEATYNDLLSYIEGCTNEGNSKGFINRKLSSVRKYYDYLLYSGKATKNPATGLSVKNRQKTIPSNLLTPKELTAMYENFQVTDLRSQRNKVILGLLVFQALKREELEKLELPHIKLHSGKIEIPGGRHSNARILNLEPAQIMDLHEYITITRPEILKNQSGTGRKPNSINKEKVNNQLFISMHGSDVIKNSYLHLIGGLRKQNPKLINAQQIRQSVITTWLKTKDLRTVQYMAGHRYVSSTERYLVNHLDDLQEALNKFHPLQ